MTNESIWDKVDSIEKRFENRLDKSNVKFNTLNPVWDNERGDALNVFEMIDELIRLNLDCSNLIDDNTEYVAEINQIHKENEQLKSRVEYLERKIDRERTSYQKQHEKWEEEIQKENEQLKSKNRGLQSELQIFKEDITHSNLQINKLADENEQLKKQLSDDFNQSNCITVQKSIVSDLKKENEQLRKEKEFWKSDACSLSSLNSILSNELSIAQEQGYEPSTPYKEYITSIKTEYDKFWENKIKTHNNRLKELQE